MGEGEREREIQAKESSRQSTINHRTLNKYQ